MIGLNPIIWSSLHTQISDLCHLTDNTYTRNEVLRMERCILRLLKFNLNVPDPVVFLERFLLVCPCDLNHLVSTIKPAVAVTCIKHDPPLSGHFRVPPNDFECKCTSIKRAPVQRSQRSAKFAPKRWNCIHNGHFPWFAATVWLNFIDKLFCTGQMLGAIKLPSSGVS